MDQFPDKELLPTPYDPFDVAAGELRRYPDAASFKKFLHVLDVMHHHDTLRESLEAHTAITFVLESDQNPDLSPDTPVSFYRGALFGMHCATGTMHDAEAAQAFNRPIDVTTGVDREVGESDESFRTRLANQFDASLAIAEQSFHDLAPERQELLFQAALHAGEDMDPEARFRFVQGFIFAAENTLRIANEGVEVG